MKAGPSDTRGTFFAPPEINAEEINGTENPKEEKGTKSARRKGGDLSKEKSVWEGVGGRQKLPGKDRGERGIGGKKG